MPVSFRRIFGRLLLILLLLAALLAGWMAVAPPYAWVGRQLAGMARSQGVPLASMTVDDITLRGIHLRDVTLQSEPPLVIPEVIVQYDRALLLDRIVRHIEVRGLNLPLAIHDGKLDIPWAAALFPAPEPSTEEKNLPFLQETHLAALPFQHLVVTNSTLRLEGDIAAQLGLNFDMQRDDKTRLRLTLTDASLQAGESDLSAGEISAQARWEAAQQQWALTLDVPTLTLRHPTFSRMLSVAANGTWDAGHLEMNATAKDATGRLEATGSYKLINDSLQQNYEAQLSPVVFLPGKFQPADLYSGAATFLEGAEGSLSADAKGEKMPNEAWAHQVTLHLNQLGGVINNVPVQGIAGDVTLLAFPLHTDGVQHLTIASVGLGSAMKNGDVEFSLKENRLRIPRTRWDWLGGEILAEKLRFDLGKEPDLETEISVRGLSLKQLLGIMEQTQIQATGELSGTVPISYRNGVFSVRAGSLTSPSGILRHAAPEQALPGEGKEIALVRKAMENLSYDALELSIDGLGGDIEKVVLRVEGRNPDMMNGKPVRLNVTLTGDLMETIRSSFNAYASPEKLIDSDRNETPVP